MKLGFGHDWVREVEKLDPDNQKLMSEVECAAQAYTLAAMSRYGKDCKPEFERVLNALEVSEAVGVAMLVGRYITHAVCVNTLDLAPPKSSIFEDTGS